MFLKSESWLVLDRFTLRHMVYDMARRSTQMARVTWFHVGQVVQYAASYC